MGDRYHNTIVAASHLFQYMLQRGEDALGDVPDEPERVLQVVRVGRPTGRPTAIVARALVNAPTRAVCDVLRGAEAMREWDPSTLEARGVEWIDEFHVVEYWRGSCPWGVSDAVWLRFLRSEGPEGFNVIFTSVEDHTIPFSPDATRLVFLPSGFSLRPKTRDTCLVRLLYQVNYDSTTLNSFQTLAVELLHHLQQRFPRKDPPIAMNCTCVQAGVGHVPRDVSKDEMVGSGTSLRRLRTELARIVKECDEEAKKCVPPIDLSPSASTSTLLFPTVCCPQHRDGVGDIYSREHEREEWEDRVEKLLASPPEIDANRPDEACAILREANDALDKELAAIQQLLLQRGTVVKEHNHAITRTFQDLFQQFELITEDLRECGNNIRRKYCEFMERTSRLR